MPFPKLNPDVEKRFDEMFNDLLMFLPNTSVAVYFSEAIVNIKSFLAEAVASELTAQRERMVEKVIKLWREPRHIEYLTACRDIVSALNEE